MGSTTRRAEKFPPSSSSTCRRDVVGNLAPAPVGANSPEASLSHKITAESKNDTNMFWRKRTRKKKTRRRRRRRKANDFSPQNEPTRVLSNFFGGHPSSSLSASLGKPPREGGGRVCVCVVGAGGHEHSAPRGFARTFSISLEFYFHSVPVLQSFYHHHHQQQYSTLVVLRYFLHSH